MVVVVGNNKLTYLAQRIQENIAKKEMCVKQHNSNISANSCDWLKCLTQTTRSSAIAEGPSRRLKSCKLPRNSAETTCTTSPEPNISCR